MIWVKNDNYSVDNENNHIINNSSINNTNTTSIFDNKNNYNRNNVNNNQTNHNNTKNRNVNPTKNCDSSNNNNTALIIVAKTTANPQQNVRVHSSNEISLEWRESAESRADKAKRKDLEAGRGDAIENIIKTEWT